MYTTLDSKAQWWLKLAEILQLNYKANYEKTKTQYTSAQDTPQLKTAKANAELISDVSI